MITRVYQAIEKLCAHPFSGPLCVAFLAGWFFASFLSNGGSLFSGGHFDPGMTVGGYLTNGVQLFMLFLACYMTVRNERRASERHAHTTSKIDANHDRTTRIERHLEKNDECRTTAHEDIATRVAHLLKPKPTRPARKVK